MEVYIVALIYTASNTLCMATAFFPAGLGSTPLTTQFCHAMQQISNMPSARPLASGGDATYIVLSS